MTVVGPAVRRGWGHWACAERAWSLGCAFSTEQRRGAGSYNQGPVALGKQATFHQDPSGAAR